jgi:acyl carrier protein
VSANASHVRKHIREFLQKSLGERLSDNDDIFLVGGASSLFAMELVMFIEQRFDIMLDDSDLERQNFSTITAMVRLVDDKRNE